MMRTIVCSLLAVVGWGAPFGKVVPIGGHAADLALDERRGVIYVANLGASRVEVISTADNVLKAPIQVPLRPNGLALSLNQRYLVVTHFGPANGVTILDLDGNTQRQISLPQEALGAAFGADGLAIVATAKDIRTLDPASGQTQILATLAGLTIGKVPSPFGTFPPEISRASVTASADGKVIYGLVEAGGNTKSLVFTYRVLTQVLDLTAITSAPPLGPRVVSLSKDASRQLIGWGLSDNRSFLLAQFPNASGRFNIGSHVIDNKRGLIYAQVQEAVAAPAVGQTAVTVEPERILQVVDGDNLTIRERLLLSENLAGRSVLSSDEETMYSVSDSGLMVLPVGRLAQEHRLAAAQEDLVFRGSFCERTRSSQVIDIVNPGGGRTPFRLETTARGISFSPASGVTPARVTVEVDFQAFAGNRGTTSAVVELRSSQAVNIPAGFRVLVNNREPDQRGTFVNVPGKLVDIVADPGRDRVYIVRQDKNQVLVYHAGSYELIKILRTGNTPMQATMTQDRRHLIVANDNSQIANVFDLDTLEATPHIVFPGGHYPRSIAVSNNAILAACRVAGPKNTVDAIDMRTRSASELPDLGLFENKIDISSVLAASPSGKSVFLAQADGTLAVYDATANAFTTSRKDLTSLGGGYAALSDNRFVVENTIINQSLVAVNRLDSSFGTASGVAIFEGLGIRTNQATFAGPGTIHRLDPETGETIRPTRTVEAPLITTTVAVGAPTIIPLPGPVETKLAGFTRTLAPLEHRRTLAALTVSGFSVFGADYDAAVTPPRITGVVNSADGATAVAPGSLIRITGENLSPVNAVTGGASLPTLLGESCMQVNGIPVPMSQVSADRIEAQLPFNVSGDGALILRTPGGVSQSFQFPIRQGAPGVFRTVTVESESGLPAVYRLKNLEPVTLSNPIHPEEEIAIVLTGLGRTSPALEAGSPAPSDPLALPLVKYAVFLGGRELLATAAAVPGKVGTYEIVARVPKGVPTGMQVPLAIRQDGYETSILVRVVE